MRDWLTTRGVPARIYTYGDDRANLTAAIEFGSPGPTLMFNSHLDVVPAGEEWTYPPFEGRLVDGAIYGRGSADAKGSLAAMAAALGSLVDQAQSLSGTVVLTAVADEEVGSEGARRLLQDDSVRPDAVVIGEPTSLRLMTAHKGSLRPVLEIVGRASHAAQPQHGLNAVTGAGLLLSELHELTEELDTRTHPLVGPPTLVPVLIRGGEAPNAVPERCRITFDRRMIPGERDDDVIAEFEAFLARFRERHPDYRAEVVELAPTTGGPSETSAEAPLVGEVQHVLRGLGLSDQLGGLVVNCDMTHFRAHGIPTVVCGPGAPEVMHARNEHLAIDELDRAVELYSSIAQRLLSRTRT
jgi:acetylornithine deacetylase/succinyl-diaminopimelate desuccinylase family protein